MADKNQERDRPSEDRDRPSIGRAVLYALQIGFFAGVIWGLVRWLAVSLNLTRVPQAFLADPWVRREALNSIVWHVTGLALFIVMSLVAALVYLLVLGNLRGPWPGILFGGAWWALLFLWIGPLTGMTKPVRAIGWNSIACELGIYLCWGLFIGYSIAFEFHDEASREPAGKASGGRKAQPAS
jgi:Conserved membrane protein YqhR.